MSRIQSILRGPPWARCFAEENRTRIHENLVELRPEVRKSQVCPLSIIPTRISDSCQEGRPVFREEGALQQLVLVPPL